MKVGFIGLGNMGSAIMKGLLDSSKNNQYCACGRDFQKTRNLVKNLGVTAFETPSEVVNYSDIFFIGVKPKTFPDILTDISQVLDKHKICVSMAAGITISKLEEFLGDDKKIIRIMPNTPALVGEAMTSVSKNKNISDYDIKIVISFLNTFGNAVEVEEELIHAIIGASGSSPAYTYMYINGLCKGAEANGISPSKARIIAAQAVLGAAKMVLETDTSLDELVKNVCSPGGTTIEAVNLLKKNNFEELVENGFQAAVDRSIEMSEDN